MTVHSWAAGTVQDAELPSFGLEPQIMGMPHASAIWTADRVRALPDDGNRYEVVDGELLVTPSPRPLHQRAILELGYRLHDCLRALPELEVLHSPADIEMDVRTLVQPDLFITRRVPGGLTARWKDVDLLLAIEVLSASTARYDRLTKRGLYHRQGIEYWIVDLDARVVERWHPADERPEILAEIIEWRMQGATDGCTINLEEFFTFVIR